MKRVQMRTRVLLTVTHNLSAGRFSYLKVFRPFTEVLHVKRQSVSFRQWIKIHSVELKHVITNERTKSAHFDLFYNFLQKSRRDLKYNNTKGKKLQQVLKVPLKLKFYFKFLKFL